MRRRAWSVAALLGLGLAPQAALAGAAPVPALIARSKPSVVLVGTYRETDTPRFQFRGTGFVVEDGVHVVTNAHVLGDASELAGSPQLQVQVWRAGAGWHARQARVERLNRAHDLALLRLEGDAVAGLPLAPPALVDEGLDVVLMGFPIGGLLGFSHVTHRGIVSAVTRIAPPQATARALSPAAIRQLREGDFPIYQLDAVAYPGNSGGPVLEVETGRVIGVLNMVFTKAGREGALTAPSGIAYAIPVARVHELLGR